MFTYKFDIWSLYFLPTMVYPKLIDWKTTRSLSIKVILIDFLRLGGYL